MQHRSSRREFLELLVKSSLIVPVAMIGVSPVSNQSRVYRFVSTSQGEASKNRVESEVSRIMDADKGALRRDWTTKEVAFVMVSELSPSEIVRRASIVRELLRVDVSENPLVLEAHRQKLGFHNYHRMRSGFPKIDVETFARHHPVQSGRTWRSLVV